MDGWRSTLEDDKDISFNAGTHTELVKMAYQDFKQMVHPTLTKLAV